MTDTAGWLLMRSQVPLDVPMLPEALQRAGIVSHQLGKWHVLRMASRSCRQGQCPCCRHG
jgi:arylsulfatase A-like enzyme